MTRSLRAAALLASLALGSAQHGCMGERPPVNRVQPNFTPVSMFSADHDWYFRAYVTGVSATNSVTFEGSYGSLYRIRWDVQENMLFAYRVDPDVLGIDGQTDAHYQGAAVAAFPILSHFDIRRDYNTTTGEELNVLVENDDDRPWNQRAYIRVDWSRNLLDSIEGFGFTSVSPTAYFVQGQARDPNAPNYNADAPTFTTYHGDDGRELNYFDVTSRFTYEPDVNTCYYQYQQYDCGPGDVRIRMSFMQADPSRQYVPLAYPDRTQLRDENGTLLLNGFGDEATLPMFDRFGFLRVERSTYDRRVGSTQQGRQFWAGRFNIWQRWYEESTDAQGHAVHTPIPFAQRRIRPIVYYVSDDMPPEMIAANRQVVADWDEAMSRVVVTNRLLEQRASATMPTPTVTNEEVATALQAMRNDPDPQQRHVVWLCTNPGTTAEYENTPCVDPGVVKRIGDLRYHFINWVSRPQPSGPLGIAIWSTDPFTGEEISSGCSIYGAALDTYAQNALEIIKVLNGQISTNDFIQGADIREYARSLMSGHSNTNETHVRADGSPMDERELGVAAMQGIDTNRIQASIDQNLVAGNGHYASDRLSLIQGTALERSLTDTPEVRAMLGLPTEGELTPEQRQQLSLSHWATSDAVQFQQNRLRWMSGEFDDDPSLPRRSTRGCMLPQDFLDDEVMGLAMRYQARLDTADPAEEQRVWQELREQIYRGVTDHEIGHSMGLRHNFAASMDAMNFHDRYWSLRTLDGTVTPRLGDTRTPEQVEGGIGEYEYSSVMDYGARFNADNIGLGYYDRAAMMFGYGEIAEIFPQFDANNAPADAMATFHQQGSTEPFVEDWGEIWRYYRHYTRIPDAFGGYQNLSRRAYVRWSDVVAEEVRMRTQDSPPVYRNRFWTVPYHFLSDEYAGSQFAERWDHGADMYEVVRDAMSRYRNYYLFDNFVRDRTNGTAKLRGLFSRVMTRYFAHTYRAYIYWFFGRGDFRNLACTSGYCYRDTGGRQTLWNYLVSQDPSLVENREWSQDPGGGLPMLMGARHGLDEMLAAMATPPAYRTLRLNPSTNMYTIPNFDEPSATWPQLTLGFEAGARFDYNSYDYNAGYEYYNRWRWISSYYDKIAAMTSLTTADANLVGTINSDLRRFQLSYYMIFPDELSRAFGGLTSFDDATYTGAVNPATRGFSDLRPFTRCHNADGTFGRCAGTGGRDDSWLNGAPRVDPLNNLTYKTYGALYSMALFTSNYNQQFNNAARIWEIGSGEQFDPADPTNVVIFADPDSQRQFAAIRVQSPAYSPGAALLEHAIDVKNRMLAATDPALHTRLQTELRNIVNMINIVRTLYAEYGRTSL